MPESITPVIHQFRPRDRPSRRDDALLRLHRAVAEIKENRRLAWEVAELRRVNQVPRTASASCAAEIDPTRRRS